MKTTRLGGMNTLRAHTHTASPPLILTANVKALQPPLDSVKSTKLQNQVLKIAWLKMNQLFGVLETPTLYT